MGTYLQCGGKKVYHHHFFVEMPFFFVCACRDKQEKCYTLMDLLVHSEQIKPSPIFRACFSHEL